MTAPSHGVALGSIDLFGVGSITAWPTQASGGANSGRNSPVTVTGLDLLFTIDY